MKKKGGGALGGARNRNPVGEFLLVRLGSSLCASSGLVLFGVRVLGVKSLEGLTLLSNIPFLTPPLRVVRGVSVATEWVSEFFFLALRFGDSTGPVIFSAYFSLGDMLGEV